ncbi:MAG: HAD hydrolase-like protein [Gemmatimonadetes bacterium]|nr:HAD hydrolase-like protein [Gemmatimonadota bacterium]
MLFLFDIDGTLTWGGPAKEAFQEGLEAVFGTAGPIDDHDFSGKTDPQIARELMARAGVDASTFEGSASALWDAYLDRLEARIAHAPVTVLPGAATLVRRLHERAEVCLALVTGNLERGARLKLGSVGLEGFFPVGAFGSDHEERNRLPGVAIERASLHFGRTFNGADAVVIGDTPRDVECGRAVGAVTVAVATGRYDAAALHACGPDLVLEDFRDTETTLREIRALFP